MHSKRNMAFCSFAEPVKTIQLYLHNKSVLEIISKGMPIANKSQCEFLLILPIEHPVLVSIYSRLSNRNVPKTAKIWQFYVINQKICTAPRTYLMVHVYLIG